MVKCLAGSTSTEATDPNFANVNLLLHGDGTNGGTTFTDSSSKVHTQTYSAGATTSTVVSDAFGGSSILLNGTSGDVLAPSSTDFALSTGDFTIECRFRCTNKAKSNAAVIDFRVSGGGGSQVKPTLFISSGTLYFMVSGGYPTSVSISDNTWYHVAISRISGVTKTFLDGTQFGSNYTDANNYGTAANDFVIGEIGDNRAFDGFFPGNIEEIRITKGVGRYSSNFTKPAVAFPNS